MVFNRLRLLSQSHEIILLTFYSKPEELEGINYIAPYCKSIHPIFMPKWKSYLKVLLGLLRNDLPLQACFYQCKRYREELDLIIRNEKVDIIHTYLMRVAPYAINMNKPKLVELIDSYQVNLQSRLSKEKFLIKQMLKKELSRVSAYENRLSHYFNYLILVSSRDARAIKGDNLKVIPLGINANTFYPAPQLKNNFPTIIFSGNMSYDPNIKAVLWFARECFPMIQRVLPSTVFWIAGINPSKEVQQLEKGNQGIKVMGFVSSMADTLNQAHVSIAPMQSGSGMQIKTLEAMACGLPVVATTVGVSSLNISPGTDVVVADSPKDFASAVVDLLSDPEKSSAIARNGLSLVRSTYTWESYCAAVNEIYREILQPSLTKG